MRHLDLFTGIGGFALSASWVWREDYEPVAFCEIDDRCREFLSRAWPGVPVARDVRELKGADFAPIDILTGGPPCQSISRAGKRRGTADNRWLWPEALRVLAEVKPRWALFENPSGIGDVALAGICADMEAHGYEVGCVGIPACAVGAPHRRERYWIVAHSATSQDDCRGNGDVEEAQRRRESGDPAVGSGSQGNVADTAELQYGKRRIYASDGRQENCEQNGVGGFWRNSIWLPCADGKFRRAPDDSLGVVNGLHRSLLAALGNSIVPQVAAEVMRAMKLVDDQLSP